MRMKASPSVIHVMRIIHSGPYILVNVNIRYASLLLTVSRRKLISHESRLGSAEDLTHKLNYHLAPREHILVSQSCGVAKFGTSDFVDMKVCL
jgi:hypothetical protein